MCTAIHNSAGVCHQDTVPPWGAAPLDARRHSPSPWPHTSPAWPAAQKRFGRSTIPSLISANCCPSYTWTCARDKHNKAKKYPIKPFKPVMGSSGLNNTKVVTGLWVSCPCKLLGKPGVRHQLLVTHLLLNSERHWEQAHRPKPQPSHNSHCSVSSNSDTTKQAITNQTVDCDPSIDFILW